MINTSLLAEEFKQRSARNPVQVTSGRMTREEYDAANPTANATSTSSSSTTRTWTPSGPVPVRPEMGTFTAPEYDEGEIAQLRQRQAGPQIRKLRDVTLQAISGGQQGWENPNIRRTTVRQALQGYGSGLGSILSSAQNTAMSQYNQRYQNAYNAAQTNFEANRLAKMTEYQNLWTSWAKQGTERTNVTGSGTNTGAASSSGLGITSQQSTPRPISEPQWSPETKYQNFTVTNQGKEMPYFLQGTSGY